MDKLGKELWEILSNPIALNAYAYTGNNPLVYTDPDGEFRINFFAILPQRTQISIGNWGNRMYNNYAVARYAMDHPVQTGIAAGIVGGGLVAGGTLAAGGSITCGILCGGTAAEVATVGGTAAVTQGDKLIKGAQNNLNKLNSAVTTTEKARAILGSWSQQTFESVSKSIKYHWAKYGKEAGLTVEQYTKQALEFFSKNSSKAVEIFDKAGNTVYKIRGETGGIYTETGKIISFWIGGN